MIETKPEIGNRIFAGIIDYSIILFFTIVLVYTMGTPNSEGEIVLNGLPILIPVGFWFFVTIGMEQFMGRTIGNYAVDLKAIPIDSNRNKLSLGQSIKRHLLDVLDMTFFGVVGILCIKNSERNQRLGDMWAETVVVKQNPK